MAITPASPHDQQANGRNHATRGRGCVQVPSRTPNRLGGGFAPAVAPVIFAALSLLASTHVRMRIGTWDPRIQFELHTPASAVEPRGDRGPDPSVSPAYMPNRHR